MSENLLQSSLPLDTTHLDQIEIAPNKMDSSTNAALMDSGVDRYSLQQTSMHNSHYDMVESGLRDLGTPQIPMSKYQTQMLDSVSCASNMMSQEIPVSSYEVPLLHAGLGSHISHNISPKNLLMGQTDAHLLKVHGQTDPFENQLRDVGHMMNVHHTSLLTKRKAPMETSTGNLTINNLSLTNKRMVSSENRPWLQPPLTKHQFPINSPTNSAGSPHSSVSLSKRSSSVIGSQQVQAAAKRSAPTKVGHATSQKETFESVRAKLRESLASALSLAAENKIKMSTSSNANNAIPSEEPRDGATIMGPKEDYKAMKKSDNFSGDLNSGCKEFHPIMPLSVDDVSFSDSFFVKDELLQGNGLSWVMESDVMLLDKKGTESDLFRDFTIAEGDFSGNSGREDETPETLAHKIEAELFKLFKGVNKKYKEKGRSLLFNLKDRNNPELGERVLSGDIPPERLCSMSAEDLASKELSQWRIAKAEELAQMVVLPDTEVDVRRLVKKTHKGEFQVELEEPQTISVQATSAATKDKLPDSSEKSRGEKPGAKSPNNGEPYTLTIPSGEGADPMQGLMVDDELKDADFLPPIVSLDEFMESLNSEPPFQDISKAADRSTSDRDTEDGDSESKSSNGPQDTSDAVLEKPGYAERAKAAPHGVVKPSDASIKPTISLPEIKGERVWDGLLQLNISALIHVVGIFKSGEKASSKEWPCLIEVKGRVKVEAFGKFLQELPLSRSRAVMAVHFVCKVGTTESDLASVREVADSYVADDRVGFAEPVPGVELYVCPPHGKTRDILRNVVPKDASQDDADDEDPRFRCGLIGVVVWRRVSKHASKRVHPTSRRLHEKSKLHLPSSTRPAPSPKSTPQPQPPPDGDDDVPPGFGPLGSGDDDDLPEFNFSAPKPPLVASRRPPVIDLPLPQASSRPVDEIRQLIHKYGQSESRKPAAGEWSEKKSMSLAVQSWNDDDDDDMPEWRPDEAPPRLVPRQPPLLRPHVPVPVAGVLHQKGPRPYTAAPPGYPSGSQWPAADSRGL